MVRESAGETRTTNVIELIKQDHDRARDLWSQYKLPSNTTKQKQMLAYGIIREVSMHAAKEEEVVYPAMRETMGDMGPDHLLDEHQDMKQRLAVLSAMPPSSPNFDGLLQEFMMLLLDHMREEEEDLMPKWADKVDSSYLEQLGKAFNFAKLHAPSRPHPMAPNKPPLNILANVGAGVVDGMLDAMRFQGAPPL